MPKGLSPLTLIGITKGLVEGEEEQRRHSRKRKRAETVERFREQVPTVVVEEESGSEEREGYEAYSKQPVLSPTTDEATPAQARAEEK